MDDASDQPRDTLELWDYRRRVDELYARARADGLGRAAWERWCADRDELFATHPQSAIAPSDRAAFTALPYFPYDPSWALVGEVVAATPAQLDLAHSGAGTTGFKLFGYVRFTHDSADLELPLYWLDGYGGGVFLPFRDATNGSETYGGGRYLLDTVKGADLGHDGARIVLDFNYAYHPSCVHDDRWSCPLALPESRLGVAVRAGERLRPR